MQLSILPFKMIPCNKKSKKQLTCFKGKGDKEGYGLDNYPNNLNHKKQRNDFDTGEMDKHKLGRKRELSQTHRQ